MRYIFTLLVLFLTHTSNAQGTGAHRNPVAPNVLFTYTIHPGCDGDELIFTNKTTPGQGNYHFKWIFDGVTDETHLNPSHVFHKAGSHEITLSYTNANDATQSYSYSQTIITNHPIVSTVEVIPANAVCWQVPMSFTATTQSNLKTTTMWDMGDGTVTSDPTEYTYANPGEYKVRVNVTDEQGCMNVTRAKVQVVRIAAYTATHDTDVCLKEPMQLHAFAVVEPSSIPYSVEWAPAEHLGNKTSVDPYFTGVGDFIYTVTASTSFPFCTATDTEAIHSYQPVTLTNVTPSQTVQAGSTVQFNASGALYYAWLPKNGTLTNPNISSPIAVPVDSVTKYMVYGMSEFGCLDSAAVVITTTSNNNEIVPSAFTPNGDGINDIFRLTSSNFQKINDFSVFDRWGHLVFKTNNMSKGWDGTYNGVPQEIGVFSYRISVTQMGGTNKVYSGNVTLLR